MTQETNEPSGASGGSIAATAFSLDEVKALEWAAGEALRQADSFFFGSREKQRLAATLFRLFDRAARS